METRECWAPPYCAQALEGPSTLAAAKGPGSPSCDGWSQQEGTWEHRDLDQ